MEVTEYKDFDDLSKPPLPTTKSLKNIFNTAKLFISTSIDLIRALLVRAAFVLHILIAIAMVSFIHNDIWYMVNSVGIAFIGIEWFFIALKDGGKDPPWFSPSFFLYIISIIPSIWFLEMENIRLKILSFESSKTNFSTTTLQTESSTIPVFTYENDSVNFNDTYDYGYEVQPIPQLIPDDIKAALSEIGSAQNFAMTVEVGMMLIIIIGRWIMPKKGITRSELSQLLLLYMALASDIIDLLSVLQEQNVMKSNAMVYSTLSIYSWSLFQFTLNMVTSKASRTETESQNIENGENLSENDKKQISVDKKRAEDSSSMHNELWIVLITLLMQDGPFFIIRSVCVFNFNVVSYLFLFFTFKNGILFSLQIYRIIAICTDKDYNYDSSNESNNVIRNAVTTIGNGMLRGDLISDESVVSSTKSEFNLATIHIEKEKF